MVFPRNNQNETHTRIKFKKSMLAMCIMAIGAPSFAQTAAPGENIDEIVVTGTRANLQSAQEIKKNASTFVDSISSEDIGSLPDRSVLEAMQRIPGISIERFAGANDPDHFGVEGSGATIRGMSATRSEFNGRDSFTANSGRGLSFQDVPPELMAGVDVYKNQSADMIEGGIGGTVSLRTRKPFDSEDRVIAVTADYSYGDMAEEWTPTFSALFSDRWTTGAGEFGLLLNYANASLIGVSHGIQSDAYVEYRDDYTGYTRTLTGGAGAAAGPNDIAGAEAFEGGSIWMPLGSNATMKEDDRTRKGYNVALQWESPDQTMTSTFQFMRSDANLSWKENAIKYQSGYDRRQAIPLAGTEYTFDSDGLFQSGIITQDGSFSDGGWRSADPDNSVGFRLPHAASWANPGVQQFGSRFQTDTRVKETTTVVDDTALNFKWTPDDKWEFSLDLQYIKADTEDDDVDVMMATHAIQDYSIRGKTPKLTLIEPWHGLRDQNIDPQGGLDALPGSGPFGAAGSGTLVGGKTMPGFSDDTAGDSNYFQDINSYYWQSAMDHYERSGGESKAARFDTTYNFDGDAGLLSAVKAGIRYADREQTVRNSTYNWGQLAPIWVGNPNDIGWLPAPVVSDIYGQWDAVDWSDFQGGDNITVPGDTMLHPSKALVESIIKEGRVLPTGGSGNLWENMADRPGVIPGTRFLPSEVFITQETNQAAYVRFDFETDVSEHTLKGNLGLRYVKLERDATGSVQYPDVLPRTLPPAGAPSVHDTEASLAYVNGIIEAYIEENPDATVDEIETDLTPQIGYIGDIGNFLTATELGFGNNAATVEDSSHEYDTFLPSFNLAFNVTDDLIARFAIAKAIAMPDMGDVRNTTTLGAFETLRTTIQLPPLVEGGQPRVFPTGGSINGWSGSSGNPTLEPMESNQADLSLEWYFSKVGSLTFTVFKKELSNFFVQGAFDRSYTNPVSGVTQTATVTGTTNNGEGELKGFEIAYQQFYDMLPAPFDGFGTQLNYSYIDSTSIPNAGVLGEDPLLNGDNDTGARVDLSGMPLQGQSKKTYNATLMYDKYDWSVRLAYNWRSRYLLTTRDVISRYPLWNDDAGFLDGSVFYNVTDNVTVGMQFTNLLNTTTKTIMILDGNGLEAGRSWFENDRRASLVVKAIF
jgi:iron complex outermembrane recepter protein